MAQPKRKTSKSRRDKRRTHWKAEPVTTVACPNCKEPKLPHRVCPNCGYYNGKPILTVKEK
ncbi:MAG: 50S ribosomal protein L32 [Candidatus Marinimicrobia bacterium]|nr:50S ribosomal protein L32 [Candidatus Neomarinimicrobiota bacterium]